MKTGEKVAAGVGIVGAGFGLYWLLRGRGGTPPPAPEIILSNLSIAPTTVNPGQEVTIGVRATNHSAVALAGTVKLQGDFTDSQSITLEAGASQTVTFTVVPTVEKTYQVSVDGLSGNFLCTAAPHGDIQLSDLTISPTTCTEGDVVTIMVTATNVGNANELKAVTVYAIGNKYGDTWQSSHQVLLEPGRSQTVEFSFQPLVAQTYSITADSLSGSLVVNPVQSWPGWTNDTLVTGITVTPNVAYVGQTINIDVAIEGPWPATYPLNIEARIQIDGQEISNTFTIEFRNPELRFQYLATIPGSFTVTAQDKTATFTVLENVAGHYYSPFGGVRLPLITDIVFPDVAPFTYRDFTHPGGDIRFSELPDRMKGWSSRGNVGQFSLDTSETPNQVLGQLSQAQPATISPSGAVVRQWVVYVGDPIGMHIRNTIWIIILATDFTCSPYWDSKDELASMIMGYCGNLGLGKPSGWTTAYGVFDMCHGARDYQTWPGISSACTNSGYCTYTISCPFYTKKSPSVRPENFDKLSFARAFLNDIETNYPNHPLTEPAWF